MIFFFPQGQALIKLLCLSEWCRAANVGLVIFYWKSQNFQKKLQPKDKKNWVVFVRRKKETQSCCYLQGHARQWRSREIGGGGGRRDGGGGGGLNMHNTLCCCRHRHFFSSSSSPFQDDDHKTPKEKEKKNPTFLSLSQGSLSLGTYPFQSQASPITKHPIQQPKKNSLSGRDAA